MDRLQVRAYQILNVQMQQRKQSVWREALWFAQNIDKAGKHVNSRSFEWQGHCHPTFVIIDWWMWESEREFRLWHNTKLARFICRDDRLTRETRDLITCELDCTYSSLFGVTDGLSDPVVGLTSSNFLFRLKKFQWIYVPWNLLTKITDNLPFLRNTTKWPKSLMRYDATYMGRSTLAV